MPGKIKYSYCLLGCFVIGFLLVACSTKKDTFMNRTGHAMTSRYNVLFNGQNAFDEAKKQLDEGYEDNFWERLPIEPMKIEEKILPMPGQSMEEGPEPQGFEKAEEKAVKAVQKHSMVIDGLERNKQIDEAYLLLGKSRYYLQRFIPALEAFTFGIENYPNANQYRETKIWKGKAHIRLQNEELAIETLRSVVRSPLVSEEEFEKAHTAMAMAYTQLDSTDRVIDHLKKSTYYMTDRDQGARNLFILGQIYREKQEIDSSNTVFDLLTYMKHIPRKYQVHAAIERAKNYSSADSTSIVVYTLQDLIKDRDNREYLDELYYQMGLLSLINGDSAKGMEYFGLSIRHNSSKPFQKSLSYESMGDLHFDQTEFELAGAYYDSVLQLPLDQNTKRVRRIIRMRESLNDVITYENLARRNDSILHVAGMSPEEQKAYFEAHVQNLKRAYELEMMQEELNRINTGLGEMAGGGSLDTGGKFYFYNPQVVGMGKQQFQAIYGNRPLTDFWLVGRGSGPKLQTTGDEMVAELDTTLLFSVDYYLDQVPKRQEALDSIALLRNEAYYQLGLIYKEQFGEYQIAAQDFETFLAHDPIENLVLPAKYHLFKTYAYFNAEMSNKYRDDIVSNYPDSRYAEMILNPRSVKSSEGDDKSPESVYKSAFICYEEQDYSYALRTVNEALARFKGHEMEAKFELLKAYLLLRTEGEEAFIDKLQYVIVNFPSTTESEHAEEALQKMAKRSMEQPGEN